jgi:tRNA(Ile)-lysidine synthase
VSDLLARVAATGMLEGPLLVLLSGGRDSVCLLDCAVRAGAEVRALHVDHGLRPGTAQDAEPVAAGHTATDQVETVLYRLASSPGRRALLGMDPAGTDPRRPLLAAGVTREATGAHCAARGLPILEDPANGDPRFARTRVREGLVPALRAVDPRAEANVLATAQLLRDEAAVLDAAVDAVLAGGSSVGRTALAALPPALGRLVLRRLAEDATGGPCPRAATRLDEVLALEAGALDLGDGARVHVEAGLVRMGRTPPRG